MSACDYTESVSCDTCEDTGWTEVPVEFAYGTVLMDVQCPNCDGQTPAFIVGHDDRVAWLVED